MALQTLEGSKPKAAWSARLAPGRLRQGLVWRLQALGLAAFWRLCAAVPPERAADFAGALMMWLGPRLRRHSTVKRNMRRAFRERSRREKLLLARGVWANFGRVLAEYPHLSTICREEAERRLEVVVQDESAAWRRGEKPAVFVTGHLGNWELCAATVVGQGLPLAVVYSPQENPLLEAMIQRKREALDCGMVSKDAGIRELIRHIENGRSIGLLADQRVDSGEPVPFFGRPSLTTLAPARLALKFGLELVPMRVERRPGSRFRVTFHPALRPRDKGLDRHQQALDLMGQFNALFESWVRRRPSQWNCMKRRWKWQPPAVSVPDGEIPDGT